MEATLSTFSAMSDNLEKSEQVQTPEPIQETTTTEPAGDTPEQTPESTPVQEENVSSFSLGITEEEIPIPKPELKESTPSFNWKDEIKKIDKKELLKEAGVHEFAAELNDYLLKGGKAADYLSAKSIDYNQISDEEIIKSDLKKQYPTFTGQQIDLMFNRKYAVSDVAEDEEKEFVALQLKADAYNSRQSKITEQQKFVIPETPILPKDEAYEQWKKQRESEPQLMEQLRSFYNSHEATKALNESKRVAVNLGDGVAPFNFSIDRPDLITQMWTDGGELANKLTTTKTGEPDVAKQQLIALFSFNPQRFIQDIFAYGQKMGVRKELVEEGQNAIRPQAKVLPVDSNQKPTYSVGKFSDRQR